MDVVLGHIGCVPSDGTVVGIVMEDSQAMVSRGGSDDEVDRWYDEYGDVVSSPFGG